MGSWVLISASWYYSCLSTILMVIIWFMLIAALPEALCLDYANTLSWRGRAEPSEQLTDVTKLLEWLATTTGLAATATKELKQWARGRPERASELFAEAIAIREAIYAIFSGLASGNAAGDHSLGILNAALAKAPARRRLARRNGGYGWRIERADLSAPSLLAPVLWSAADLMVRHDHRRIRQCANEKCLWLFADESKSGTRRWCDMASCGNRAKASRHYRRHRGEQTDSRKTAPSKG